MDDDILAAVRARREAIFARCGYDLRRLAEELRSREGADGREVLPSPAAPAAKTSMPPAQAG